MRDALNEFAQCLRTRHARNTKTYRGDRSDAVFGTHGPPAAFTKAKENIMASFKTLAALALLSVTTSTPTFSTTLQRQPGYNYVSSGAKRARVGSNSWCLHNYSADEFDCSYAIEANVRRQQQETLASVSQALFGKCIRGAARDSNALQARR